jgi:cytochrome d ubiquinol oxidase subunit I
VRDGIAYPVDWLAIIFNPSFPYRFAHMLTAAYLTTAFVVLAVGARYLVARRHEADGRTMVRMAIGMIAVLAPLQLFLGDQHGLNTLKHQPIKIAAMEAHWDGSKPGDFHIFAWPDEKNETNRFALSIPRGSSLVLTHDPNGLFPGLKSVPPSERPPVVPVFFAFRIMVGIGLLMIAIGLTGAFLAWRGRLTTTRWYLQIVQYGWWLGFVAILCGWITTEVGRQPWIATGILRTADAISPVTAASVLTTLVLFVVVYGIVFTMGIYYINRLIVRGPQGSALAPSDHGAPRRPLSAAEDAAREALGAGG